MVETIVSHARNALPAECCGLLLAPSTAANELGAGPSTALEADNELTIAEAVPIANTSADPNRFFLEPEAHITERRRARERGLAVVGFYHSHPHSSAAPSITDLLEASYPDHLYLIVSVASRAPQIRLFRYCAEFRKGGEIEDGHVGGTFVEMPFVTSGIRGFEDLRI